MKLWLLACLVGCASAVGPGSGPPRGGPRGGGKSGKPCPCTVERDDNTGTLYGCCAKGRRGLAKVKPGNTKKDRAEQKFLATVQDRDAQKPPNPLRPLSSKPKGIPNGIVGRDCDYYCVWVRPYAVFVPFTQYGWVNVYRLGFHQYIRYCYCQYKFCRGFLYFHLYWTARCQRIFTYTPLFVWIFEPKYFNPKSLRWESRYVLRQKWFRFPSACACGHPEKFDCKNGPGAYGR